MVRGVVGWSDYLREAIRSRDGYYSRKYGIKEIKEDTSIVKFLAPI